MANKQKSRFINTLGKELKLMKQSINQRMGVYILVSHLLITMSIIVLYGLMMFLEKDTTVIEGLLFAIIGYWFGAITKDSLKSAEKITDNVTTLPTETQTIIVKKEENNNGTL